MCDQCKDDGCRGFSMASKPYEKSEELKRLLAATPKPLDAFLSPSHKTIPNGVKNVEYKLESGTCIGHPTYSDDFGRIRCQAVFISKGTEFPMHTHNVLEVMTVFEGRVKFIGPGKEEVREREPGDPPVYYAPGERHGALALEDSWLYCTSVPEAEGYP